MKGDVGEAVAAGAHALFFPHGLGHMIGLDVHDLENMGEQYVGYEPGVERSEQFGLGYLRLGRTLKPGFVLTGRARSLFHPAAHRPVEGREAERGVHQLQGSGEVPQRAGLPDRRRRAGDEIGQPRARVADPKDCGRRRSGVPRSECVMKRLLLAGVMALTPFQALAQTPGRCCG